MLNEATTKTPALILDLLGRCTAQTFTTSDQHATVLLTHPDPSQGDAESSDVVVKSLLKMTLVPYHKSTFASAMWTTTRKNPDDKNSTVTASDAKIKTGSSTIIDFLSHFDFQPTSDSGAEYSFYTACPKQPLSPTTTDTTTTAPPPLMGGFHVELISPATPRPVTRALPSPALAMVEETPELYDRVTRPYLQAVVESGSLAWLDNVISLEKETERLLFDCDDWLLNVDTKWRTHADPRTLPDDKSQWRDALDDAAIKDLYCLAILKAKGVATLRDLRRVHVPMLKHISAQGKNTIAEVYGVPGDQLRVFVHYVPQFFHFHVHFTRLENEIGAVVERGHLVSDIVQNLESYDLFYAHRTICYKLSVKDTLYRLVREYERRQREHDDDNNSIKRKIDEL